MELHFFKYQGTGNDFILVDNREGLIVLGKEQIARLCDRRFGIGSDGFILIERDIETHFHMNFFNPDGSQSFCGNGSRCAVAFFRSLGHADNHVTFRAIDGLHEAEITDQEVQILMRDVKEVKLEEQGYFIHTGSPHLLCFKDNLDELNVVESARIVRYNDQWKKDGVNVNYIEVLAPGEITVRTYERGVEDETWSCGTGVTAAALAYHHAHGGFNQVEVHTKGGRLSVRFEYSGDGRYTRIWLCGSAVFVFNGSIEI